MAIGIYIRGSRQVILRNVVIKNFEKGIVAENSNISISRGHLIGNLIGLEAKNSRITIANSTFRNIHTDIYLRSSIAEIIDTHVKYIIKIIRSSPVLDKEAPEAEFIAHKILATRDPKRKVSMLKELRRKVLNARNLEIALLILQIIDRISEIIKALLRDS
ncbi:hypothetical protein [Pyrococcus kukulkanii]|uniref:hypothetical protein n=1 Tax=Pyrococcus kukulkanii TaxID=1609559 RepID=UPI003569348D